ncbi:MAG: hypothetical protein KAW12_12385, partial [Candidatus Aminicenantes bacterium]|nr:hypothetical protein [Candidatus Aminicenantes bacterium]
MIREIRRVENEQLVINIPKEYIHRGLEILVFPVPADDMEMPEAVSPDAAENLKKFHLLMKKAEKANIRVPQNVDIDNLIDEMNNQTIPAL